MWGAMGKLRERPPDAGEQDLGGRGLRAHHGRRDGSSRPLQARDQA